MRVFLDEMNLVVPCRELVGLIQPFAPAGTGAKGGRPSLARLPDVTTILRFRHLLEEHKLSIKLLITINDTLIVKGLMLKTCTAVDATPIGALSSTKNSMGEQDPEMHQVKKGKQWHFGMKVHIVVDADSGLVHTVIGKGANFNDVTQGHGLLHG